MSQSNAQIKHIESNLAQSGYKLLIVDDDEATLQFTKLALTAKGFQIVTACNGVEALMLVEKQTFDGIILDALMPELDGFKTCQAIRYLLNDSTLPIVIATGLDDSGSIDKAFSCGASDFITKPLNFQILSSRLNVIFDSIADSKERTSQTLFTRESLQETVDYVVEVNANGKFCHIDTLSSLANNLRDSLLKTGTLSAYLNCFKPENQLILELLSSNPNRFFSERFTVIDDSQLSQNKYEMQLFKNSQSGYYLTVIDLTEQYTSENRLKQMVNYDTVTHLPNANYFLNKLNQWRLMSVDNLDNTAVVTIALTNLNKCELKLGTSSITRLLKDIADKLSQELKKHSDCFLVSRYSSDTFVFSVQSITREKLDSLIQNIHGELSKPFEFLECSLKLTIAVGACHGSLESYTPNEMLKNSSISMNANTTYNKDFQMYDHQLKQELVELTEMENALRKDINANQLEVYFQPKYNIKDMTLCGAEALIRWQSAEFGFVPPSRFIPIAEVNDMMEPLGKLVIKQTLSFLQRCQKAKSLVVPISINLDVQTLGNRQFIEDFINDLDNMQINKNLIEIEVTESIMADPESNAIKNIEYLQNSGFKISMDDFGTGYSSFSYLQDLPLDVLKIDMSFIRNIHQDSAAASIVKAIIEVGHSLKLEVIAEGVENQRQLDELRNLGCDIVQGYLTGKPMPKKIFGKLMSDLP